MKKDKEWLKAQIKDEERELKSVYDNYVPYEKVLIADDINDLINQLDEPELPAIPQFVADWIEECKARKHNLFGVYQFSPEVVSVWIFENESKKERVDLIARAWLDGYTIEKEKLYHVLDKEGRLLIRKYKGEVRVVKAEMLPEDYPNFNRVNLLLTEKEIKDYDERYWAFAEEVSNV